MITKDRFQVLVRICSLTQNSVDQQQLLSNEELQFVIKNGLAPWLFNQIKHQPGSKVVDDTRMNILRQIYIQTSIQNRTRLSVYHQVNELLTKENIPFAALKGMALAYTVYADEGLRPMGDMDLIVPEGYGFKARDILIANGAKASYVPPSECHEQISAHVRPVVLNGMMIELHQRFFAMGNGLNIKSVSEGELPLSAVHASGVRALEDHYFAYHLASHTYYGYQMKGLRLGWFLDLALLLQRQSNPDQFIADVLALNPAQSKNLARVFHWVKPLLYGESLESVEFPAYELFHQPDDIKKTHRWMNLNDLIHTPGLKQKGVLLYREFFPEKEYLQFRYGQTGWRAYRKRLLRF
jgi:hypothetical protein